MMGVMDTIASALPWIGTALGGPLGGVAVEFVSEKLGLSGQTTETIKNVLGGMSPEKLAEFKAHDQDFALKMAALGYDQIYRLEELNTRNAGDVNKTMQSEANSEHWPTYSWRPAIGFAVAFDLAVSSILVLVTYVAVICGSERASVAVAQLPLVLGALAALIGIATPILGIASYFRGKAQADPDVQSPVKISSKG